MTAPGSSYRAPLQDILDALEGAGLPALLALPSFAHVDAEMVEVALEEFGRLAAEVVQPTDAPGDVVGSRLDPTSGLVVTAPGFVEAYRRYVETGWGTLSFPERFDGGGFPAVVGMALQEIFASANTALSLNTALTQSAIELLLQWGDDRQQALYLPKMVRGLWTGTMDMTESEAGSDLGEVRTLAELQQGGSWLVSGTKIFISWGEHDLAENIIHLVLARTPGAPPGTKGLSLFLVPKYLPDAGGNPGKANSLGCVRVENKLGLHGSPTCVMQYDKAVGELVGELHGGLRAMFTMMNLARLSIGVQGPAIAERAYQQAHSYANERLQGRTRATAAPARSAIAEHPDVARMLLHMRTLTLASRLLLYTASAQGDQARQGEDEGARRRGQARFDLLTPIAKAWSTDNGVLASSVGMQVLGGAGYVEETGMAQRLRDSRIGPIYEGTNGIQAIDLVTRKLPRDGGRWVRLLLGEVAATIGAAPAPEIRPSIEVLGEAHGALTIATEWLLGHVAESPDDVLAGATAYLEMAGMTIGGWLMAERALRALRRGERSDDAVTESNFFAAETTARATGLLRAVTAGAARLGRPSSS